MKNPLISLRGRLALLYTLRSHGHLLPLTWAALHEKEK